MPVNLNYDASVPITKAPFSVQVDPKSPPGDRRYKDFIPKNPSAPRPAVVAKDTMRKPVTRYDVDYIPPQDAAVKRQNEKASILQLAKQMYADEASKRKTYIAAQKIVEDKKADLKDKERALKVLSRSKPMTKEEALQKATEQFYNLRS